SVRCLPISRSRCSELGHRCLAVVIPLAVAACAAAPLPQESAPSAAPTINEQAVSTPDSAATYHFMLGYQAELAQDSETAIREYRAALKADPSSIEVQARLAVLYFGSGDMTNAVQFAEAAGQGSGQDVHVLTQMASILAGAGKADRAIRLLDLGIGRMPDKGEPYFSKGMILLTQKRLPEAEQVVKEGLKHASDSPAGYYYLGRISIETGNAEQALDSFEQAVAANPSFEPAYLAQVAFHESRQDKEKAIAVLQKYLHRVNPNNKEARQHLIQLYVSTKNYAAGLAELEMVLKEDPGNLDAKLRKALIYGEKKEHAKAIEQLTEVLQARPAELKVRDYLGYLYEETKDFPKAIETYRMNIQLDPTFPESQIHLGVLQYRLKQFPEAIVHLNEAVRLVPKQPEPHIVLGLAYLQSEHFDQASAVFEEGIRHNPNSADLHFNLGTAYDKLNRFDDVVRAMEAALSLDPHHADALNYLGYSYAERGIKIDQALSLTRRAVALKPENGYYVDSLGWAFYKSGLLTEALTEIKRAVTLVGDDPVIFEHLGEIYVKQQNLADAREAWLHSLELDPSNEKLLQRFREQGLGDPAQEDRIQQARRRVSEKIQTQQVAP
ncbi:MAG TPA: tetratricopeptide repeat protein, partial [Nitrospira sp.]|nr:tetratricopeptide repeat protein [Nitrospira sp.]